MQHRQWRMLVKFYNLSLWFLFRGYSGPPPIPGQSYLHPWPDIKNPKFASFYRFQIIITIIIIIILHCQKQSHFQKGKKFESGQKVTAVIWDRISFWTFLLLSPFFKIINYFAPELRILMGILGFNEILHQAHLE